MDEYFISSLYLYFFMIYIFSCINRAHRRPPHKDTSRCCCCRPFATSLPPGSVGRSWAPNSPRAVLAVHGQVARAGPDSRRAGPDSQTSRGGQAGRALGQGLAANHLKRAVEQEGARQHTRVALLLMGQQGRHRAAGPCSHARVPGGRQPQAQAQALACVRSAVHA